MDGDRPKDWIDHRDPLPAGPEPTGRWAFPYRSSSTGKWTVHIRRPLSHRQLQAGLIDTLTASTSEDLQDAMAREDERAAKAAELHDSTPTWPQRT